jgi:thioredoxin reductase (NADPH)
MTSDTQTWEIAIVGGGIAGASAAIYLGRALRRVVVIDSGHSLAKWEPDVQNYLGFPEGVSGDELLKLGQIQAKSYDAEFVKDEVTEITRSKEDFVLRGSQSTYRARRVLLATSLFHLPPEIPDFEECCGQSMFFCKDCDGYRVQDKRIAIVGANNEAVEYALSMMLYSASILIATNGQKPGWDEQHAQWIAEYKIPFYTGKIVEVESVEGILRRIAFAAGPSVIIDALFTTRGDVFHNKLAKNLGAKLDEDGQVIVDHCCRTNVPGLFAAGCVTPANCQMIIAAGQGAIAAQAINRELFEESLENHQLRRIREEQIEHEETEPVAHDVAD